MTKYQLYCLKDPNTLEIRYIGITTASLKARLSQHLYDVKVQKGTHKINWIRSLLLKNLKPIIELLEICDESNWEEREKFWIKNVLNLTNTDEGGKGIILDRSLSSIERSARAKFKAVVQLSLNGDLINTYECIRDAVKAMNCKSESSITNCLKHSGRSHTCRGFLWMYESDFKSGCLIPDKPKIREKEVIYETTDKQIFSFKSTLKASDFLGISREYVSLICLGKRENSGYNLKYKEINNDIV